MTSIVDRVGKELNIMIRRVSADWKHPVAKNTYVKLLDGKDWIKQSSTWDTSNGKWNEGFLRDYNNGGWKLRSKEYGIPLSMREGNATYTDYAGPRPVKDDYMPVWLPEELTHYQVYICYDSDLGEAFPFCNQRQSIDELATLLSNTKHSECYPGKFFAHKFFAHNRNKTLWVFTLEKLVEEYNVAQI